MSLRRTDHSSIGVLPNVVRRCVVRCDLETWPRPTQGCRSNDDDNDGCLNIAYNARRAMPQAVNRKPLVTDTGVRSQISPRKAYGGQSDIRTVLSPSSAAFRCHYHFTNAPYWIQFLNNSCFPRSSWKLSPTMHLWEKTEPGAVHPPCKWRSVS
jgi:hypothetical protein